MAPSRLAASSAATPVSFALAGDELRIAPDRLAVLAPVEREGPARQAFAGDCPGRNAEALERRSRSLRIRISAFFALGRADGLGVPFGGFEIVDRDEGRLAAHGEADVFGLQDAVDLASAERVEFVPAVVGEGLGDARMLGDVTFMSKANSVLAWP